MLSSSCSCPGLFSFACLPLASLYLWNSDSSGSAVVCSLSFCLGVRSAMAGAAASGHQDSPPSVAGQIHGGSGKHRTSTRMQGQAWRRRAMAVAVDAGWYHWAQAR